MYHGRLLRVVVDPRSVAGVFSEANRRHPCRRITSWPAETHFAYAPDADSCTQLQSGHNEDDT